MTQGPIQSVTVSCFVFSLDDMLHVHRYVYSGVDARRYTAWTCSQLDRRATLSAQLQLSETARYSHGQETIAHGSVVTKGV